jgi:hypothetical protein
MIVASAALCVFVADAQLTKWEEVDPPGSGAD